MTKDEAKAAQARYKKALKMGRDATAAEEFGEAVRHYRKALSFAKEAFSEKHHNVARVLLGMGIAHSCGEGQNSAKAEFVLDEARAILGQERFSDPSRCSPAYELAKRVLDNLASVAGGLGKREKQLECLVEACGKARAHAGDSVYHATQRAKAAVLHRNLGRCGDKEALALFLSVLGDRRGDAVAEGLSDAAAFASASLRFHTAGVAVEHAEILMRKDRYDEAAAALGEAEADMFVVRDEGMASLFEGFHNQYCMLATLYGRALTKSDRREEGLRVLRAAAGVARAAELDPELARVQFMLTECEQGESCVQAVRDLYETWRRAPDAVPERALVDAAHNMVSALVMCNRARQVRAELAALTKGRKSSVGPNLALQLASFTSTPAREMHEAVGAEEPQSRSWHRDLCFEAFEEGRYEEAADMVDEIVDGMCECCATSPFAAELMATRSVCMTRQGAPGEALAFATAAMAMDTEGCEAKVHLARAEALRECDRNEEAAASYKEAGNALYRASPNAEGAGRAYHRGYAVAIELAPDMAATHSNAGLMLRLTGQYSAAVLSYTRAAELAEAAGDAKLALKANAKLAECRKLSAEETASLPF